MAQRRARRFKNCRLTRRNRRSSLSPDTHGRVAGTCRTGSRSFRRCHCRTTGDHRRPFCTGSGCALSQCPVTEALTWLRARVCAAVDRAHGAQPDLRCLVLKLRRNIAAATANALADRARSELCDCTGTQSRRRYRRDPPPPDRLRLAGGGPPGRQWRRAKALVLSRVVGNTLRPLDPGSDRRGGSHGSALHPAYAESASPRESVRYQHGAGCGFHFRRSLHECRTGGGMRAWCRTPYFRGAPNSPSGHRCSSAARMRSWRWTC